MKIIESEISNHIIKTKKKELGTIFFFNHIAVIEFNEGVDIDINNSIGFFDEFKSYFGNSRPFGVIANRIYSYSVKLMDADLFRNQAKNLCAYGVVGHNPASKMNAKIENNFCLSDNIDYDNLYEAIDSVYNKVKQQLMHTLN
ncbi:hypothetical protein Q4Q39_09210 [Flavivirga amylovorans]|uniref:Uncharacterized protein n=1 Tax=Flavivirga amylovorans TaxID=870486 RepID=A0ABT8X0U7_9FLAO|nr:hypothetical protein [Flavivirga amylovorans]MDO5987574.1 hypothetical protein [Flavivirga amylovorans]